MVAEQLEVAQVAGAALRKGPDAVRGEILEREAVAAPLAAAAHAARAPEDSPLSRISTL